ncbi:negative elongation factor A [Bactrocera tryoni]|uniref:negative elongation factor A n=1 Tax=Bactrocera tryoni TaxID=59916 RepID=UPI001A99F5DA|nr:negative elongation factor A [Bactrocera tryoni]XP_039958773.1 negative elongation factor A [Bactrocera tryoni]XP_039958774.1 negative elongation factor A [Bactrocera tryoni]XP_039958775.1 negative elongation factor A [Bactrocera tryoni]
MYITNSSNIGMATLLQQNKATCMKTLINGGGNGSSNGNNGNSVGNSGIVVGSIVSGVGAGTSQVGGATVATVVGAGGAANIAGLGSGGVGGNLVLSTGQAIVLTNGATGASSIINYQQYQQLLQQQQHQQQQQQHINSTVATTTAASGTRVLMPHEMVTLPISSIVTTSGGGLALITSANTGGGSATATQGHFLVAATASPTVQPIQTTTMGSTNANISSFQQQFQQQIAAQHSAASNVTSSASTNRTTTVYTQQPSTTGVVQTVPTTRYFSQFSNQQQPISSITAGAATPTIVAAKATGNRTIIINRSNNTIIAGNTTQRLQHAKILNKPPTNIAATPSTLITNAVLANKSQINHNSLSPAIQAVKLQQQPQRQNITALQQIKQQQLLQQQKIQLVKPIVHSSSTVTTIATKTTTVANTAASSRNTSSGTMVNGGINLVPNSSNNSNKSGNVASATTPALAAKALPTAAVFPQQQQLQQQQQQQQLQLQNHQQQQQQQQQLKHQNQSQQLQSQQLGQAQELKQIVAHSRTIPATPHNSTPVATNKSVNSVAAATPEGTAGAEAANAEPEVEPEIDIVINNVVCSFSVRCHLNLRDIALKGFNVEYRRENGMVTMKLRRPYTTASIWSSGRITCTGATSEEQAKIAARRYSRCLEKLGFRVRFQNFRVVNVLGTCSMPWAIKILNFSERYKKEASYEPELHPGVTYKLRYPKATLKIFSTGSITVTAASVANVQAAIEHIFPLVYEFRKKRSPEELEQLRIKQARAASVDVTELEEVLNNDVVVETDTTAVPTLQRRRVSNSALNNFKQKRRRIGSDIDFDGDDGSLVAAEEIDDPTAKETDDNIVMYDPDDLIEGPDDEDDL